MTQDQVFVPSTRTERGLKPFDSSKEDLLGSRVTEEVKRELWEALGDSPIGATLGPASYLVSDVQMSSSVASQMYPRSSLDGGRTSSRMHPVKPGIRRALIVSQAIRFPLSLN